MADLQATDSARLPSFTFDAELRLEDGAAAVTDSTGSIAGRVGAVGGASAVIDLGADAVVFGTLVAYVSSLDFTTGNEAYQIELQGSNDSDFLDSSTPSGEPLLTKRLGDATSTLTADVTGTGRLVLPFCNIGFGDVVYRYLRLVIYAAGTSATITVDEAFLAKPVM